jgi:hypothetical protein
MHLSNWIKNIFRKIVLCPETTFLFKTGSGIPYLKVIPENLSSVRKTVKSIIIDIGQ